MRDQRVFVVGSLNADHRVRVRRIPSAGETVLGADIEVSAGGKGANQAVAAVRAGAAVTLVGAVGDDRDGVLVRHALADQEIDSRHLRVIAGVSTGRAMITVDDVGENAIVVAPGANSALVADDVDTALTHMGTGDLLLLQLESPMPLVTYAARGAAAAGGTVVLNAAPVPTSVGGLLQYIDVLVVNDHELTGLANLLCGKEDRRRADRKRDMALLASVADATVVCTAGSDGAFVARPGLVEHVEATPVPVVDTTAAGDTFIGYLAATLAADPDDLIGAIRRAVRAAGITVTRPGAIESIPHAYEIATAATAIGTKGLT
jgi:ribokinase